MQPGIDNVPASMLVDEAKSTEPASWLVRSVRFSPEEISCA
jgi:hypothetical protein